jgi:hypothetical protein
VGARARAEFDQTRDGDGVAAAMQRYCRRHIFKLLHLRSAL